MTRSAVRQPASTASTGATTPASINPAGTPVCLIEKTSGARCRGESRPSKWELDGVETAWPRPPMKAPAANSGSQPAVVTARPMPKASMPTCVMRSAP